MNSKHAFADIIEAWRKAYESYPGAGAVWRINQDIACEFESGVGAFTEDPLPDFPAQALDAPRDFDGGTLARFIEGDDG